MHHGILWHFGGSWWNIPQQSHYIQTMAQCCKMHNQNIPTSKSALVTRNKLKLWEKYNKGVFLTNLKYMDGDGPTSGAQLNKPSDDRACTCEFYLVTHVEFHCNLIPAQRNRWRFFFNQPSGFIQVETYMTNTSIRTLSVRHRVISSPLKKVRWDGGEGLTSFNLQRILLKEDSSENFHRASAMCRFKVQRWDVWCTFLRKCAIQVSRTCRKSPRGWITDGSVQFWCGNSQIINRINDE